MVVRRLPPLRGVEVFTIGLPGWFDREVPYSYQDDDVMPFVLFSKAIATLAAQDAWRPDIIHCNDWHCGLVAQEARLGPHRLALDRTGGHWSAPGSSSRSTTSPIRGGSARPLNN